MLVVMVVPAAVIKNGRVEKRMGGETDNAKTQKGYSV
jgi:hypothetical protein